MVLPQKKNTLTYKSQYIKDMIKMIFIVLAAARAYLNRLLTNVKKEESNAFLFLLYIDLFKFLLSAFQQP
jgi:hypothetical protein